MFEEPYRWIEAVRNRREYLEEQLSSGSPVVSLPYQEGIVITTLGSGTGKLYEVYDQIALGGLGHPTDLEKLRTTVLEIAHIEGFNRSPADVNLQRLIKFGIAPLIKQAFEEILHAPYISKLLFAELTDTTGLPRFLKLNYDGMFEDNGNFGILGPTAALEGRMAEFLKARGDTGASPLKTALQIALRTWALSLVPSQSLAQGEPLPEARQLDTLLKERPVHLSMEVALLDRTLPGSSKYRALSREEISSVTQDWLR